MEVPESLLGVHCGLQKKYSWKDCLYRPLLLFSHSAFLQNHISCFLLGTWWNTEDSAFMAQYCCTVNRTNHPNFSISLTALWPHSDTAIK